jgi:aminoglycoside-2''-adenylyltransferase
MIDQRHLDVLRIVVQNLANQPITWAVTGSCGFALQGLDVVIHDIDLQTDGPGAYAIERAFADRSVRKVVFSTAERIRSHFGALEIETVRVEIMGDVQKRLADGTWEAPVDVGRHRRWVTAGGLCIPVLALEYEHGAYLALGRAEQAEMLERWLKEHGHADLRPRPE